MATATSHISCLNHHCYQRPGCGLQDCLPASETYLDHAVHMQVFMQRVTGRYAREELWSKDGDLTFASISSNGHASRSVPEKRQKPAH